MNTFRTATKLELKRYEGNPILGPTPDIPWMTNQARNTAATIVGDEIHLLFTASGDIENGADMVIGHAVSKDGIHFDVDPEPWLEKSPRRGDFDHGTVEDTRITKIDDTYFITYAARSFHYARKDEYPAPDELGKGICWNMPHARRSALLTSKDMKTYERIGPITDPHYNDANVVFFPRKINGRYAFLHRPTPFAPNRFFARYFPAEIWVAFSEDHREWDLTIHDNDKRVLRPTFDWEAQKVGASGPPIETDEGWLVIYHGVDFGVDGGMNLGKYRAGLMLLDLDDPTKIIAHSPDPILEPKTEEERVGRVPNVVFPCGNVVRDGTVYIYYGASDTYTNLATVELQDMLDYILTHKC